MDKNHTQFFHRVGVADNDAQVIGFLKSHLSGDLFTWMRIANPAGRRQSRGRQACARGLVGIQISPHDPHC